MVPAKFGDETGCESMGWVRAWPEVPRTGARSGTREAFLMRPGAKDVSGAKQRLIQRKLSPGPLDRYWHFATEAKPLTYGRYWGYCGR